MAITLSRARSGAPSRARSRSRARSGARLRPARAVQVVVATAGPAPTLGPDLEARPESRAEQRTGLAPDIPWHVVVWDDPVNLMSWVTWVFRTHFGFDRAKAHALMLEVHERGRAIVAEGTLEQAETHVAALHGYGLMATYERAGGSGGGDGTGRSGGADQGRGR